MCEISSFCLIFFMCIEACFYTYKSQMFIFMLYCLFTLWFYYFTCDVLCDFSTSFDMFFSMFIVCFYCFYFASKHILKMMKFNFNITFLKLKFSLFFRLSMLFCYCEIIYGIYLVYANSYANLRSLINSGSVSLHSAVTCALVTSLLYIEYMYIRNKKEQLLLIVTMFILAILSTSKMFIVLAVMYAVPWYIKDFKIGLKGIFIMIIMIIAFFALVHSLTGVVASYEGTTSGWLPMIHTMHGYYLGGLAAFQYFLDGYVFAKDGWVRTGLWVGNVYSAFTPMFAERDYFIFFVRVGFMGAFYGLFIKNSDSLGYLKVYSWLALLMIFYDYMFGASQLICFMASAIFVNIFSNQLKYKKDKTI